MRNRAAAQAANAQQQMVNQQQQQQNPQLGPLGNMNSIYGTRPQVQANNFINEQTYISAHDSAQLAAQKQQQQQQQQQQFINQSKAMNAMNTMNAINAMNAMNNLNNLNMNNVNTLPTMNSINNLQQQQQQQLKNQQMLSNSVIYQGLQSIKEHFTSVSDSDTSSGIHSATTGSIISTTTPPNVNSNNLNNSAYNNASLISSSLNSTNQMMQMNNLSHNDSVNGQKSDSVENLINCIQAPKPFLKSLSMTRQAGHQFQQLQQQRQQSQPSFNLLAPLPPPPRSSTNQQAPQPMAQQMQMHPQLAQLHNMVDMRNILPFEPPTLNAAELIAINGAESIYGTKTAPNVNQQTPLLTNNSSINAGINSLYGRLGNQMSSFSSLPHGKQQQQKQLNSMNPQNCNTISNSGSNLARQNQMLPLPPQHLLN